MTKYSYLLKKKESGELSILLQLGLSTQILSQMEICEYHLSHPRESQFQVALRLHTNKLAVWRAYKLFETI